MFWTINWQPIVCVQHDVLEKITLTKDGSQLFEAQCAFEESLNKSSFRNVNDFEFIRMFIQTFRIEWWRYWISIECCFVIDIQYIFGDLRYSYWSLNNIFLLVSYWIFNNVIGHWKRTNINTFSNNENSSNQKVTVEAHTAHLIFPANGL